MGVVAMKAGDTVDCPHCGKSAFLKKESVMDGWTKTGEILACASCGEKIADLKEEIVTKSAAQSEAAASLASLLGTEKEEAPKIEVSEEEKQFCRDCSHFIVHPFLTRCSLHKRDVNPMDDCPDFSRKESK